MASGKFENTLAFKFIARLKEEASRQGMTIRTKNIGAETLISIYDVLDVVVQGPKLVEPISYQKTIENILKVADARSEIFMQGVRHFKFSNEEMELTPATTLGGIMYIVMHIMTMEHNLASIAMRQVFRYETFSIMISYMMGNLALSNEVNLIHKMKQEGNNLWDLVKVKEDL